MKLTTSRLLALSFLLMPSMLLAKPPAPPQKKKPAATKPAAPGTAPAAANGTAPANKPGPAAAPAEEHHKAYGMAGCGFGSAVIHENSMVQQILANTVNSTSASQTFGISFGTLNCKTSGKAMAQEQKVFIEANLVSLKREAVSGKGETLNAFADLLGCQADEFNQVSKANYQQIYKASEADAILQGYKAALTSPCERLI